MLAVLIYMRSPLACYYESVCLGKCSSVFTLQASFFPHMSTLSHMKSSFPASQSQKFRYPSVSSIVHTMMCLQLILKPDNLFTIRLAGHQVVHTVCWTKLVFDSYFLFKPSSLVGGCCCSFIIWPINRSFKMKLPSPFWLFNQHETCRKRKRVLN